MLAVSTTAWPVHLACGAALLVIAALAHTPVHTLARRMRIVIPALLLVAFFIPFRGTEVFVEVGAKALIGTFSAVLLAATTPFPDVLHALERLCAPKLLVLIAAFMYRYLFVIVDEVHRMRAALASRGYAPATRCRSGRWAASPPRCSCAPTSAPSACTWRCSPAASTRTCRVWTS